jgi:hypothetical protein
MSIYYTSPYTLLGRGSSILGEDKKRVSQQRHKDSLSLNGFIFIQTMRARDEKIIGRTQKISNGSVWWKTRPV